MVTKQTANYVAKANKRQCKQCTMFRKPDKCTYVEGRISPQGHCKFFERKKGLPVR